MASGTFNQEPGEDISRSVWYIPEPNPNTKVKFFDSSVDSLQDDKFDDLFLMISESQGNRMEDQRIYQ